MTVTPHSEDIRWRWLAGAVIFFAHGFFAWACFNFFVDDPYISLRYARNLAEGHGLVYNIGERVEGYSNLLWVLLLTVPHLLGLIGGGADAGVAAKALSAAAAMGTVLLMFRLGGAFAQDDGRRWGWCGITAGAILATIPGWGLWSVGGLEGPLHAFLLLGACVAAAHFRANPGRQRGLLLTLILIAVLLNRPEGLVHAALILSVLAADSSARRSGKLLAGVIVPVLCIALLLTVGRSLYYGELIPNSAIAKTTGMGLRLKIHHGLHYTLVAIFPQSCLGVALVLALVRIVASGDQLPFAQRVGWVLVLGHLGGCIVGGGDWMPASRYIVPVYPILTLLAVAPHFSREGSAVGGGSPSARWLAGIAVVAILGVTYRAALQGMTASAPPPWREFAPVEPRYHGMAEFMATTIPAEDMIAIGEAGYIPYRTRHRVFDCFGLVTPEIARAPARGWINSKFDPEAFFAAAPAWVLFAQVTISADGVESFPHEYSRQLASSPLFHERYAPMELPAQLHGQGWRLFRAR